jgi:hypothetical protein
MGLEPGMITRDNNRRNRDDNKDLKHGLLTWGDSKE